MKPQSTITFALSSFGYLDEKFLLNEVNIIDLLLGKTDESTKKMDIETEKIHTDMTNLNEIGSDYGGNYDTIIRVGTEPDIREFRVGSIILCSRSSYFRTALSSKWARKEDNVFIIEKPNVRPIVFDIILR